MSDKPKRPWFRFHLLTAVLMMVVGGGIVYLLVRAANVQPGIITEIGWPYPAISWGSSVDNILRHGRSALSMSSAFGIALTWRYFIYDVGWIGSPVLAFGYLSEWLIACRREGGKL